MRVDDAAMQREERRRRMREREREWTVESDEVEEQGGKYDECEKSERLQWESDCDRENGENGRR